MIRVRLAALVVPVMLIASTAPIAAAHTLTSQTARATATTAAKAAAKQTRALSYRVVSCNRQSSHRALCKVALRYRTGAKACTLEVRVSYRSHASKRAAYAFGRTVCA